MPRIPRHTIDEVRNRTDIVEVVQRFVSMKKRGNSYVGLCPFHQEKTPSFHVVPHKHLFHCFGCQESGDVFKFLMQMEGLSFVEAVKELAEPAGVVIEERELSPEERRQIQRRATTYDVLEAACAFFENTLWTKPEGQQAREYLERRGLSQDTVRRARLGYAPGGWTALLDHLHGEGFPQHLAVEVGLARERKSGSGHYDFLRERVIFPIRDERGRVIAFGGRILEGDAPKYMNTPESSVYDKSSVLYGLDIARGPIQRNERVILVEGYMDVLALHQAGYEEAVATCGTSLTTGHMSTLRRMTGEAIALFDADEAGARAAERSLPLFLEAGLQPWRLHLPDAKDPDDLIREQGVEVFEQALAEKVPLLEWYLRRLREQVGSQGGGNQRLIEEVSPLLAHLPTSAVPEVATALRVPDSRLLEAMKRRRRAPRTDAPPPPQREGWRPTREMVHLLWLLVHRYDQVADLVNSIPPELLDPDPEVRGAVARLVAGEPVAAILPTPDPGLNRTLSAVVAREHLYPEGKASVAMCEILNNLASPLRQAAIARLNQQADEASRRRDFEAQGRALAEASTITRRSKQVQAALRSSDVARCVDLLSEDAHLRT